MNRWPKASVREFRRPRAGDQGDEAPPPGPPTLSSVPGLKAASRRGAGTSLRPLRPETFTWRALSRPTEPTHPKRKDHGCIGPSLAEEALAGKASLRCHLDSATHAERQAD
jgi:hypothetical protein